MRIQAIHIERVPPISLFDVSNLADVVVVAGRNGVGKTRLVQSLVEHFMSTRAGNTRVLLEATCDDERRVWRKSALDTGDQNDIVLLQQTLHQARRRSDWRSSVVQFESNRSIMQVSNFPFTWDFTDPFAEMIGWQQTLQGLTHRFNDMVHSLFRKFRSHRESIAQQADEARRRGEETMRLDWQDPLLPFKTAFSQLLAPKQLADVDPQRQTLEYYVDAGSETRLPITSLSSGEREVLNIVFDFLLRNPQDCVVIFDEPQLHLHPELSYRLLQTLRSVGARNQFLFCTHSPDIITASLDQSIVFVAPPSPSRPNQAVLVAEDDRTNEALRLLGQSVGIIALGKRLVLIEGTASSLDKQTYGSVLRDRFPDLVLVPAGGKGLISSFAQLIREVLDRTLWGVDFFMLCDRDAVPSTVNAADLQTASKGRLRVLARYHLENYFLDSAVLARVFDRLEPVQSPLRSAAAIEDKLRELATGLMPYATALTVVAHFRAAAGNVDLMPKGVHEMSIIQLADALRQQARNESSRIAVALEPEAVANLAVTVHGELANSLASGTDRWKTDLPGRQLLHKFANYANIQAGRLKQAYIAEAVDMIPSPFDDIVAIFASFSGASTPAA